MELPSNLPDVLRTLLTTMLVPQRLVFTHLLARHSVSSLFDKPLTVTLRFAWIAEMSFVLPAS